MFKDYLYTKIPIIILSVLSLFMNACNVDSREQPDSSLLEIGFNIKDTTETKKILDPFKSKSTTHYGIDISHFQGDIVSKLNSTDNLQFVICKATQGDNFVDPDFRNNWNEIKEKGLIRGTYHFYDCSADPIKQANLFTSTISDINSTDIAPILDIEQGSMTSSVSGKQMVKDILVFLKTVEQKLNRKPILYTNYAFANEYLINSEFANYDLWLAEYSGAQKPLIPTTWKNKGFKIWQKSDTYSDHSTQLDFDVFVGELREIIK